jgi:hypothetical protein
MVFHREGAVPLPLSYSPFPFPPTPYYSTAFLTPSSCMDAMHFGIVHSHSLLSSVPPNSPPPANMNAPFLISAVYNQMFYY